MAITRYAGDRFTIAAGDTKPTGVLDGAVLIDTGNLELFIKRDGSWVEVTGAGSDAVPGDPLNSVQFNNNGAFGGDADLTFTDGNRLNVNKLGISGNVYDSNNWIGEGGMILANEGATGINWKNIESVLSGVGGSGVANYVAKWSDEDTLTSGIIQDNGTDVSIISSTTNKPVLRIENTNADNTPPFLDFYKNSASAADDDYIGKIQFKAKDSLGTETTYADIYAIARDITHTTEDGNLYLRTLVGGSMENSMFLGLGKVGIATNVPVTELEVYGASPTIRISDSTDPVGAGSTIGKLQFYGSDGSSGGADVRTSIETISENAAGNAYRLAFLTSAGNASPAEKVTIRSDGNVGIGTTNPAHKLYVNGGSIFIDSDWGFYLGSANAFLEGNSTGTIIRFNATAGFKFTDGGTTQVAIDTNGQVGIGTDTPASLLHVFKGDSSAGVYSATYSVADFENNNHTMVDFSTPNNKQAGFYFNDPEQNAMAEFVYSHASENFRFASRPSAGAGMTTNLVVDTTGVGIGTNLPVHRLHVGGDAIISGYLYDSTNSTGTDGYVFTTKENGPRWEAIEDVLSGVGGNGTANYIPKWEDSDTIGNSIIYDNGSNIGIGNAVPSGTLDIVGSNGTVDVAADGDAQELVIRNNDRAGIQILSSQTDMSSVVFGSAADANGANISYGPTSKLLTIGSQIAGGQVVFRAANGVEAVRIDAAGKVGIGTTAPATDLHIKSADPVIRLEDSSPNGVYGSIDGAGGSLILSADQGAGAASSNMQFKVDNAEAMRVIAGGSVGIGTAAPKQKLHIFQTEGGVGVKHATIRLGGYLDKGAEIAAYRTSGNSNNMGLRFSANNVTNGIVDVMTLDDAGHVGIGTLTPDSNAQLHVAGYANKNTILSVGSSTSGQSYGILNQAGSTSADYSLRVTSKAGSEYLYVRGDGNVGIGNAAPVELLHVGKGESSVHGQILISADSGLHHYLRLTNGGGTSTHYPTGIWYAPSGRMELRAASGASTSNVAQLVLAADGNVGIGTITPSMTLEVAGQMLLKSSSPEFDWVDTGAASNEGRWRADVNNSGTWALKSTNDAVSDSNDAISITRSGYVPQYVNFPNGKVGIGTTAPSKLLTVNPSTAGDGIYLLESDSANPCMQFYAYSNYGIFTMYERGDPQNTISTKLDGGGGGVVFNEKGYAFDFRIEGDTDQNLFFLDGSTDKIGIGTDAPVELLTVSAGTTGDVVGELALQGHRTGNHPFGKINFYHGATATAFVLGTRENSQDNSGGLMFNTMNAGTEAERVRISYDGTLDIKSAKLKINGSGGSAGQTLTTDGSGNISWSAAGSGTISGSGTDNYVPRFNGTSAVQNSAIYAKDDGNVGIGTNAPDTNLEIYQSDSNSSYVHFTNSTTGGGADNGTLVGIDAAENFRIHNYEATDNIFVTNGIERMRILSDGKVGIGTTAPTAALDVRTATAGGGIFDMQDANTAITSGYKALALSNSNATAGNHTAINFSDTVGGSSTAIISAKCNDHTNNYGDLQFWTRGATGYGTRLHIDQEGSVGIGTAVPVSPLHVKGTTNTNIISIGVGHADGSVRSHWGYDAGGNTTGFIVGTAYNSNAAKFQIRMKGTASSDAKVTILGDGNVGIGTTAPENQLHVYDGSINCYVKVDNGSDNAAGVRFKNPTSEWYVYNTNAAGGGNLRFWENSGSDINFTPAGKIGIGTTAPTADLHVYEGSSGGTVSSNSNIVAIESNTNNGLQFLNPSANNANINFGDNNANEIGFIQYQHATDKMNFRAGGTTIMTLVGGNVGIGTNAPDELLRVGNANVGATDRRAISLGMGGFANPGAWNTPSNGDKLLILGDAHSTLNAVMGIGASGIWFKKMGNATDVVASFWGSNATSGSATQLVTIKDNGKVGIGTNAPSEKLEVVGKMLVGADSTISPNHADSSIAVEGTGDNTIIGLQTSDGYRGEWVLAKTLNDYVAGMAAGDSMLASHDTRALHLGDYNSIFVTISDSAGSGKVGIGTVAPAALLHLKGGTATNEASHILFENTQGAKKFAIGGGGSGVTNNGLGFRNVTDNTLPMIISDSGKVGIGTTSPDEKLDVAGNIMLSVASSFIKTYAGDLYLAPDSSNVTIYGTGAGAFNVYDNSGTSALRVKLNSSGDSYFTGGDVGIGTNAPGKLLTLSSTNAQLMLNESDQSSDSQNWLFNAEGGTLYFQALGGTAGSVTSGSTWMQAVRSGTTISSVSFPSSDVGIGTAAPGYPLTVKFDGAVSYNGATDLNGESIMSLEGTDADQEAVMIRWANNGNMNNYFGVVQEGASAQGDFVWTSYGGSSLHYAERMRLTAGGNVGIGTTAPSNRLEVNGNISFTAGDSLEWNNNAGTRINASHGSAFMSFDVAGTSAVLYLKPTAVGIGTNAPDQYAKLHTLTDGTDNQLRIEAHRNDVGQTSVRGYFSRGSAASPVIVQNNDTIFEAQGWGYDGTNHWRVAEIDFQVDGTPGTNDMPGRLVFSTTADGATAPTERMRIGSDGTLNLISAKLKINGSGGTAGYHLQTDGSGNISWAAAGSGGGGTVTGTGTANYVSKWTGASSQGNSSVFDNGSVGISTAANLNSVLNVYGGTSSGPTSIITCMSANATIGGGAGIFFKTSNNHSLNRYGAQVSAIRNSSNNGSADLVFNLEKTDATGLAERMRIQGDGNVGIGTTAPGAYKLRVEGDVYISGTLTEASSSGIKENIETYSPSLDIINKIRPVRYNKKKSNKKEVGLVAEELAEMFPELVEMDEKGNAVGVNYSRAVAVLLHGFKELYKEVKEIKEKI